MFVTGRYRGMLIASFSVIGAGSKEGGDHSKEKLGKWEKKARRNERQKRREENAEFWALLIDFFFFCRLTHGPRVNAEQMGVVGAARGILFRNTNHCICSRTLGYVDNPTHNKRRKIWIFRIL